MMIEDVIADQNPWRRDPAARRARGFAARRDLFDDLLAGLAGERRATVLLGPRQVGKTTLLLQVADALVDSGVEPGRVVYFDLSDERVARAVPRDVVDAALKARPVADPCYFLLDEIGWPEKQAASRGGARWSTWLKQAVQRTPHRYLVTDSSAVLLRGGSRESGPGRWNEHRLEGLTFLEWLRLQARPEETPAHVHRRLPGALDRFLQTSGFPEYVGYADFARARESLRRDIIDRAIYRDLAGLDLDLHRVKDLFAYLVQGSGAILSARAVAEAMEPRADPRSVQLWVEHLEDTMLIQPLGLLSGNARRRAFARRKVYAADHGLVVAFAALPSPLMDADVRGRAHEAVAFRHLRWLVEESQGQARLSSFRQKERTEVDFVYEDGRQRLAIEVGAGPPDTRKVGRLQAAARAAKAGRAILMHGGAAEERNETLQLLPLERFLLDPQGTLLEV